MNTYGFEVEFAVDPASVKKIVERIAATTADILPDTDSGHLLEFRTPRLAREQMTWKTLNDLRVKAARLIKQTGFPYTYYGFHTSAWGGSEREPVLARCVDQFPSKEYLVVMACHRDDDLYVDVFLERGRNPRHAIVKVQRENLDKSFLERECDVESMRAAKRFCHLVPNMKEALAWRPVPGGTIRILNRSRLEMVAGWCPPETERVIIEGLVEAFDGAASEGSWGDALPVFSQKGKFGISWMSGECYRPSEIQGLPVAEMDPILQGGQIDFFDKL